MAARSLNRVLLIGNLTRDPEIRYTSSGAAMCTFGMATNRSWKDSEGELREEAEFHNIVAWNKMAEVCYQILAKGMKVYVEGELRTRSWEDEASGDTRYRTEIKLNEMILLDSKGKSGVGGGASAGDGDDVGDVTMEDVEAEDDAEEKKKKAKKPAKKNVVKKESRSSDKEESEENDDPLDDDLPF